jgi:diguanylate cyclase (GGDEF)-like protein
MNPVELVLQGRTLREMKTHCLQGSRMPALDLLLDRDPFVLASALTLGVVLLWLGSSVGECARSQTRPLSTMLTVTAVVLVATGVWWPGYLMAGDGTLSSHHDLRCVTAWGLAFALASMSRMTAVAASRLTPWAVAAGALSTLALTSVHALLVSPGILRAWGVSATWWSTLPVIALALTLMLLHARTVRPEVARRLRAMAAPIAAVILSVGSAMSAGGTVRNDASDLWPGTLALCCMVLLAAVLLLALRQGPRRVVEAPLRVAQTAPVPDGLTQLPTRVQFEEQLATAVTRCDKSRTRLALLFIDLDGFKPINDTFGHSNGDRVLAQVGERLRSISRTGDVVARVGGDEFVLLVTDHPTQETVVQVATRLIDGLSRTYAIDDRDIAISCSVGSAFYPDSGDHAKLLARADAAMYAAKRAGGSCHRFYSPEMDADAREQFDLLRDLRQALERGQIELFYQPKIDARSGKVTAAEALLRWKHATRGLVLPGVFIPIAERFGLIRTLGNWVIEDACRQARLWRDNGLRMRVAINLSAHQMRQEDIVHRIESTLQRYQIHPSLLTCEITESVAMEDTKATQETFRRLGEAGIHLSIDDFGTGYSSLSYLRKLPAEELKIDRSFVMDVENSADARAVVDAVVKLAHALGLRVVAEGVENPRQQQILVEMGCDELQGYLFAKPMPARSLLLWALDDKPQAASFRPSLFGETQQV